MQLAAIVSEFRSVTAASTLRSLAARTALAALASVMMVGCGGSSSSSSNLAKKIVVQVVPSAFSMGVGSNYQFSATVTGATNTAVNWEVNGVAGGNASVGTIDNTGLYIAPGTIPGEAISVAAVAQADGMSSGTAAITLGLTDPLGTATGQTITCPPVSGAQGAKCYSVAISCPGIADLNGYLWVNTPAGAPIGTVMLTTGGNSTDLYEPGFKYGGTVVAGLLAAGYVTVQTSFGGVFNSNQPFGWQTGPGGIRRVACRYATLAKWVQDNIASAPTPMCATGNSAGSALIGYALAHYGGTSIFTMVEPTSGPPFSRLDYSCECNQHDLPDPCGSGQLLTQCVGLGNAQKFIDPAYPSPICSQAVQAHSAANSAQFLSDSILSPEATLSYPHTSVHFVWGGLDLSSAPVMGQEWQQLITPPGAYTCVADAGHTLPDTQDAAAQVLNDIVTYCH